MTAQYVPFTKSRPDRPEQRTNHEVFEKNDQEKLKNEQHETVQLPCKFMTNRLVFLDIFEDLDSMLEGHLTSISLPKHQIDLINEKVRPVQSALYHAEPLARQSAAADISLMIAKNSSNW